MASTSALKQMLIAHRNATLVQLENSYLEHISKLLQTKRILALKIYAQFDEQMEHIHRVEMSTSHSHAPGRIRRQSEPAVPAYQPEHAKACVNSKPPIPISYTAPSIMMAMPSLEHDGEPKDCRQPSNPNTLRTAEQDMPRAQPSHTQVLTQQSQVQVRSANTRPPRTGSSRHQRKRKKVDSNTDLKRQRGMHAHGTGTGTGVGLNALHCIYCAQTFRSKSKLTQHIRTHSGHKPYQCLDCSRRFMSSSERNKHTKMCRRTTPGHQRVAQ